MFEHVEQIKACGRDLGFSGIGIAPARPSQYLDAYLRWIKVGMHGAMGYMARDDRITRREDLTVILPDAKSLIVVMLDYHTLRLPDEIADDPTRGRISNYAWGIDYHDLMLPRLKELATFVQSLSDDPVDSRAYVDTGAILERSHGQEAGLGFVGKNTMLIHPRRGSLFFLGEVITTLDLPYDPSPSMPGCGSCTRCLIACPTDAFPEPYVLDARRCISYLTIENKEPIPLEFRPLMGNWVYGCDVCQDVCPWGRFAEPVNLPDFTPQNLDDAAPQLSDLLTLSDGSFKERFAHSPIKRIKRERLIRNACVAAGNSHSPDLIPYLESLLNDPSDLISEHAAWAIDRLQS